jgi:hypothetical protein
MYCNNCGLPLAPGQGACPRCGTTAGTWAAATPGNIPPAPGWAPNAFPPGLPLGLIERRIHALATAWLVYAAIIGIGGLCGLAFAHAALGSHIGPFWGWHAFAHHGWGSHHMPFFFWPFVTVAFFLRVALALAAGFGLMQRTRWGRTLAIVAGCLALIHMPFGTVLGVWTLITLLNAPNALGYQVMARS